MAEQIETPFGLWTRAGGPKEAFFTRGCILPQPGVYDWTVHVRVGRIKRRRCGLMSNNYFDHLLFLKASWYKPFYQIHLSKSHVVSNFRDAESWFLPPQQIKSPSTARSSRIVLTQSLNII